jgi:crotonobetainyl-CoA:carnitine CoA-transferase CaiB-like acyl-CoA transferase
MAGGVRMGEGPLKGLRVLEASGDVAVRYCGRLFAQLGAEVLTVIDADDARIGFAGEAGRAFGRWLDQGKVRAAAGEAGGAFDLVIAGQDAAAVAAAEAAYEGPILAITWFHAAGPYAGWRGTDEAILALTGLAFAFGETAGPPMLAQGHGPQVCAGVTAFNAALGALLARPDRRPRRIDVCVHEAMMCLTETGALSGRAEGGISLRYGVNRFAPTYPCQALQTADGWVGLTALTPQQWYALCEQIDRLDLAYDERFETSYERLLAADEIDPVLEEVFRTRTSAEWVAVGDANRIPITPMATPLDLPAQPHWVARGAFAPFDASGAPAPTLPFRMTFAGGGRPWRAAGDAPLAGLKVADFSMGWAGPLCARTLADLGADVVKIEASGHPDWWRGWEAAGDPTFFETRHNFIDMNRNKRGVDLDLATPDGVAAARALIAGADVVVENYAAGVMDKLGLGQGVQRRLSPDVISVSMPAFGAGGPLSNIRAYGSTVEQASGLPFVNGEARWPPVNQHVAYGDPLAGLFGAAAALAGLYGRGQLGGADIDLAQVACLFQFGADAIVAWGLAGRPIERTGRRRARAAPVCVVATQGDDAWLAVAVESDAAWRGLCGLLARADPDLTLAERSARADEIEAAIAGWAAGLPAGEAAARLQAAGVSAAPVQLGHTLTWDPQLEAAGFWPLMRRAFVGEHRVAAAPFAYDGVRPALRFPAPTLGEHTSEILSALTVA